MTPYLSTKITVLSFVSIVLVLFLHANTLPTGGENGTFSFAQATAAVITQLFVADGIVRIAVPFFFMMSGYLFFHTLEPTLKGFSHKIGRRVRSLLVPYLLWSAWGIIFYFVLQSVPASQAYFTNRIIRDFTGAQLFDTLCINPVPYQLWFIRDLMLYVVLSPLFYYYLGYFPIVLIAPLCIAWIGEYPTFNGSTGMLFFTIGGSIALHKPQWAQSQHKRPALSLLALWTAIIIVNVTLTVSHQPVVVYTHKAGVMAGLIAVWCGYDVVAGHISSDSLILRLTPFTFFIFAAHEPILTIYKKLLLTLTGTTQTGSLFVFIAAPLLTLTSCLMVGYVLRRVYKPLFFLLTGGRGQSL